MSAFALEPIERASVDELRSLQCKRLKATLQHAWDHSPVYRAKFEAAGVHPDDLRTLADLRKFPFTSKADLRDAVAQRWLDRICAPLDQIADGPGDASTRLHDWLVALSTTKQQMATSDPELFATFRQLTLAARAVTAAHVDRLSGQLARIVDSGITTGEFEPCDPASTGRALLHATARFHHPALDIEWHDPDLRPQLETVCTLLLRGLTTPPLRQPEPADPEA